VEPASNAVPKLDERFHLLGGMLRIVILIHFCGLPWDKPWYRNTLCGVDLSGVRGTFAGIKRYSVTKAGHLHAKTKLSEQTEHPESEE
jgi:hypothetical protein